MYNIQLSLVKNNKLFLLYINIFVRRVVRCLNKIILNKKANEEVEDIKNNNNNNKKKP